MIASLWPGLKSALRRLPVVMRLGRWTRQLTSAERRESRRLQKERPNAVFQVGGRTEPDRYPHLFRALASNLEGTHKPTILSFGCSLGDELISLKRYVPNAKLSGIDINSVRIARATKRINDPTITLWAAGSIGEATTVSFDAITCLSVLQHSALLHQWPTDCTPHLTFAKFNEAIEDIDRHLKVGGLLLLYHTSFRFIETEAADRYTPLLVVEPLHKELAKRYDRENRPILEPISERFALWRKDS